MLPTAEDSYASGIQSAGVLLLATLLNSGAYGVLIVQSFLYHVAFSADDNVRLKVTVYTIFTLETIQTVMLGRTIFNTQVRGFLDPQSANEVRDLWFSIPIIGGLVVFIVQTFYAHRIFKLGKVILHNRLISGAVIVLSILQLCSTIATSVGLVHLQLWSRAFSRKTRVPFLIWNASGAACDVVIACSMTYMLTRTKPEFKRTQVLVQRLIRLTVETGVLTACVAILNILLVVVPKGEPQYYQLTSALLSKTYSNTILVILNSRMAIWGTCHWTSPENEVSDASLVFAPVERLETTFEDK